MMPEMTLFESVSAIRSGFGEIARFSQNLEKTLNSLKDFKELETWERLRKPGSMPGMECRCTWTQATNRIFTARI